MPWKASDATSHTSKADTPRLKRLWADVANSVLKKGGSEGSAIKQANGVVAKMKS